MKVVAKSPVFSKHSENFLLVTAMPSMTIEREGCPDALKRFSRLKPGFWGADL
jgi:hypothetical protein